MLLRVCGEGVVTEVERYVEGCGMTYYHRASRDRLESSVMGQNRRPIGDPPLWWCEEVGTWWEGRPIKK